MNKRTRRLPVVIITGASSGIGLATALKFAEGGAHLILVARNEVALAAAAAACREKGSEALAMPTDVTSPFALDTVAEETVNLFGRIDVWVNCASVSVFSPFLQIPLDDFRRVIEVDQLGYVSGARAALTTMVAQGRGTLINVASVVGEVPQPYAAPYAMSKAAVRALSVSLRQELTLAKHKQVHVVTVSPPTIDTPFFRHSANYTGRQVTAMPPIYPAKRVADVIVSQALSKHPDAEYVIGRTARALARQHRLKPELTEAAMSRQTDHGQLSRTREAPPTVGTLYAPVDLAPAISDGWDGTTRSRRRKVVSVLVVVATAVLAIRKLLPTAGR